MIFRKKCFIGLLAVVFMVGFLASGASAKKVEIRVDCGPPGGGKNFRNECVTEAIRKGNPDWIVSGMTGPSLPVCLGMMSRGELEATTTGPLQMDELKKGLFGGKTLGTGPVHLRWICATNYALVTFYVVASVPVDSIDELVEKKYPINVSVGPRGSDPYIQSQEILAAYGVSFDDLRSWGAKLHLQPSGRSVKMVRDKLIDGKFHVGTVPEPAWDDLSRTRPIKILTINSEKVIRTLEAKRYERKVVPADSYKFINEDVPTLGVANLLAIRADLSPEVGYRIARAIWQERQFLHSMHPVFKRNLNENAIAGLYRKFGDLAHPGAVAYWKEQGIIR